MTALQELLAKVEAGATVTSRDASRIWPTGYAHAINAGHGSLDAAKALHDAVLPGWHWSCGSKTVYVCKDGFNSFGFGPILHDELLTTPPARAWLIAIIKAMIAQEVAA